MRAACHVSPGAPRRVTIGEMPRSGAVTRDGKGESVAGMVIMLQGENGKRIAERVKETPREVSTVCACEPVLEAEVRYVVQHEWARSVADVSRRTRLGLGACGGMRCAARCGQIVAQELSLRPREGLQQAMDFLAEKALTRAVALGPDDVLHLHFCALFLVNCLFLAEVSVRQSYNLRKFFIL